MTTFERRSVLVSTLLVAVTGIVYLYMKYAMTPVEEWAVINHPLQPWMLKAHILTAPLLVFAVGLIAVRHIWRHFRSGTRWGRRSGLTAGFTLVPMVLTGYLIQGVTQPILLEVVTYAHIASSVVFTAAVAIHAVVLARRLARRQSPAAATAAASGPIVPAAASGRTRSTSSRVRAS